MCKIILIYTYIHIFFVFYENQKFFIFPSIDYKLLNIKLIYLRTRAIIPFKKPTSKKCFAKKSY